MLKIVIVFTLNFLMSVSMMDPAKLIDHLQTMTNKTDLSLLTMDLGRTINGRTILAYGITKIKGLNDTQKQSLKKLPSVLMTSFLHPRDQHSVDLLLSYITSAMLGYSNDYYLSYVLEKGMIWIVPYVNIDGYEELIRTQKFKVMSLEDQQQYAKNRHIYPSEQRQQLCEFDYLNGVNIGKNFVLPESNVQDPCTLQYGGQAPFSEGQSKAIKKLYDQLKIVTMIDIQAKGNVWIHPYSNDVTKKKFKKNLLYPVYLDIMIKLKQNGIKIGNYAQLYTMPTNPGLLQWSADQGALALTYLVGTNFHMQKQQAEASFKKAFPVIDMLVKKATPLYQKYRDESGFIIVMKSISVIQFEIKVVIGVESDGYNKESTYKLKPGKSVIITLDAYLQHKNKQLRINISVPKTQIKENSLTISDINQNKVAVYQAIRQNQYQNSDQSDYSVLFTIIGVVVLICCLIKLGMYIGENFDDDTNALPVRPMPADEQNANLSQ